MYTKTTTLIFFLFISLHTSAQITITQADMPVIGDVITAYADTLGPTTQVISPAGPNQTWNFTSGWAVRPPSFAQYVSPSGIYGASYFPNANLASIHNASGITTNGFYQSTSTAYNNLGAILMPVISQQTILLTSNVYMPFPLAYGQVYSYQQRQVTVTQPASPSTYLSKRITTSNSTNTCDAWGTLATPAGSAQVLRVKEQFSLRVDSVFVDSTNTGNAYELASVIPLNIANSNYTFYKNGSPSYMMTLYANNTTGIIDLTNYYSFTITGEKEQASETCMQTFPNPAGNLLNIVNDNLQISLVRMRDLSGKTVVQFAVQGANTIQINTDELSNGLYLVELCDADGQVTKSEKCLVQK